MKFVLVPLLASLIMAQEQWGMCWEVNRPKEEPRPEPAPQPQPEPQHNPNDPPQPAPPSPPEPPKQPQGNGRVIAGIEFTESQLRNSYEGLRHAMEVIGLPESNNFQNDCLYMTNKYRAVLGLPPMRYSSRAMAVAQNYANKLAATNRFEHSHTDGFGENLYRTSGGSFACHQAMTAFFEEYALYHGEPIGRGNFEGYGHFTQLIWPDTTEMACAKAVHSDRRTQTIVCEYIAPGNMLGTRLNVKMGATGYMK